MRMSLPRGAQDLITRTYIETADWNYLTARDAFIGRRYWDFWWLTNHALEKYLKATLLLNGRHPKEKLHRPSKLLSEVADLDSRLVPRHPQKPRVQGLDYWPKDYRSFLVLLERQGSSSNRYGTYGFAVEHAHLVQADHLIFWARRHARVLTTSDGGGAVVDQIASLERAPSEWRLPQYGPLEKVAELKPTARMRQLFTRLNSAFFPAMRHQLRGFPLAFHNAPIYLARERLMGSAPGSEVRAEARALVSWVLENIPLLKDEVADLNGLLARYP